jgi:chemotaxis protein MotA
MAKKGSNPALLIGLAMGIGGLLVGFIMERGNPLSLFGLSALIIIVAGTLGALTISAGFGAVLALPKLALGTMKGAAGPSVEFVEQFVEYAERARKDGLLSLEEIVDQLDEPIMKKGLQLVVDGTESEVIGEMLENDIYLHELRVKENAAVFETAGGFSPTIGIIGTVMGLVLVLSHLGGDAAALGESIATAFIATLYGVGLANLVLLPIGNNIKAKGRVEKLQMELIVAGVLAIQRGESPGLVRSKLKSYLDLKDQAKVEKKEEV